jgi:hypothetical protein
MRLDRTRKAMQQAEGALAELEATADDERFRDEFVSCIGMILRVGPILHEESRHHRTDAFRQFWEMTANDPLFRFMRGVRNAEFKRGEDQKTAHHEVEDFEPLTVRDDVVGVLATTTIGDDEVVEERTYAADPPPEPAPTPEPTHTITWRFAGGEHDGEEVLNLVRCYVAWLRDTIIPQAEALTVD